GDVLAAADDRVVGAPADEQVAVSVKQRNVFGGKPAVFVEHRPDLGVAARNLVSSHEQFTGLSHPEHGTVVTADLHLDAGYRLAYRTEPTADDLVGSGVRHAMILGSEHGDRRTRLGEPVRDDEPHIGEKVEGGTDKRQSDFRPAVSQRSQGGKRNRILLKLGDDP